MDAPVKTVAELDALISRLRGIGIRLVKDGKMEDSVIVFTAAATLEGVIGAVGLAKASPPSPSR
jgi:hypothetical protein